MTETTYSPDHDPTAQDYAVEPIFTTPHRYLIAAAGRMARAEQQRLEQLLGLQDGRTPGPG